MRHDSIGLFWEDLPTLKREPKEKEVKIIPPAVWLADDYLPGLEDARKFDISLISDSELISIASSSENSFIFDIEIFQNYSLFAMMHEQSERVVYFESFNDELLNIPKLKWVMENLLLVGFNSSHFDIPIANLMINGCTNSQLKEAANLIIEIEYRTDDIYKHFGIKPLKNIDHIDLISLVPKDTSLKLCGGRIHTRRMQDLPYPPDRILNRDQADIIRWYCINDLRTTLDLKRNLEEQLDLRVAMSQEYQIDLRSKSDAQIAEAVISKAVSELNGYRARRPVIAPGTAYRFQPLRYLNYKSDLMKWVYNQVLNADYVVAESGKVLIPEAIEKLEIRIGNSCYTMGNGGLHSTEKSVFHRSDDDYILLDRDAASFYPWIILNQGLFPQHLTKNFLPVYRSIVVRRLEAKRAKNNVVANSLKIVINGSFGKLGSKYSILYAPDLMIQVTLTGQLSLLLLIESLELNGFEVVSANTDGVVTKCKRSRRKEFEDIVKEWERVTGFETEETEYSALYSRDVNNYIAVKPDGKTKRKGVYRPGELSKNPSNEISTDAIINLLTKGIPIEQTITTCNDVRSFLSIRQVRGGGVRIKKGENNELIENEYLGKSIRWYYAKDSGGQIVYAKNGNSVPRSEGAKPLMLLPDSLPQDIYYEWYINEANSILEDIGFYGAT